MDGSADQASHWASQMDMDCSPTAEDHCILCPVKTCTGQFYDAKSLTDHLHEKHQIGVSLSPMHCDRDGVCFRFSLLPKELAALFERPASGVHSRTSKARLMLYVGQTLHHGVCILKVGLYKTGELIMRMTTQKPPSRTFIAEDARGKQCVLLTPDDSPLNGRLVVLTSLETIEELDSAPEVAEPLNVCPFMILPSKWRSS